MRRRDLLDDAVQLIEKAQKPIILCGHGVLMSKAEEVLMQFRGQDKYACGKHVAGTRCVPRFSSVKSWA